MGEAAKVKRVLVATDGSPAAARAVEFAATVAKAWDGELILLTIRTNLSPAELRQLALSEGTDLGVATDTLVSRILDGAADRARQIGVAGIKQLSMSADPANAVVKVAREEHCDMIVVGRRGLSGLSRLLLGSVSEKVVANAPCAVAVVP